MTQSQPKKQSYLIHAVVDIEPNREGYDAGDAASYIGMIFNRLEPEDKLVDIRVYRLDPSNMGV